MKHIHHIVPKHAGGTNEPENLIELTVEEHARAHYLLWNQHGRWQDKVAWKNLYKLISKEELLFTLQSEGSKQAWSDPAFRKAKSEDAKASWLDPTYRNKVLTARVQLWKDPIYREKTLSGFLSCHIYMATQKSLSPESRQKRKDSFKMIGHQQGSKNSMFGKMWITNGTHSYRIDKTDSIPEGYRRGRVVKCE